MSRGAWSSALWTLLWLVAVAVALAARPLLPVDETRYLAVAWEMWTGGDYLVPRLNGETYSHKPPLLFWLITLGWAVFGVSEWWARLVAPLSGLLALALTARLARRLWPQASVVARAAPLVLLAGAFWGFSTTLTMFDTLLAAATLISLTGVVRAWRGSGWSGWGLFALGIGLGLLAKGPAVLVHTLPAALLAPLWGPALAPAAADSGWPPAGGWARWYAAAAAAVLLGAGLALLWAVPAAIAGGAAYRDAILWGQTAGRMVESFAHGRPFWWYLAAVPPALLPLLAWPSLWRGARGRRPAVGDGGARFCLAWAAPAVVAFSAFSGKQLHYLLPEFPAVALFAAFLLFGGERPREGAARRRDQVPPALLAVALGVGVLLAPAVASAVALPEWIGALDPRWAWALVVLGLAAAGLPASRPEARLAVVAILSAAIVAAVHLVARPVLQQTLDLATLSARLALWEGEGRPLAHYGKYHGQFHFLGRLRRPIAIIGDQEVAAWIAANPTGMIVSYHRRVGEAPPPAYVQPFRTLLVAVWDAATVRADLDLVKRPQ